MQPASRLRKKLMQRVTSRSCGLACSEGMLEEIGDEVVTAPLDGTILPGITRNSVIAILKKKGIKVSFSE